MVNPYNPDPERDGRLGCLMVVIGLIGGVLFYLAMYLLMRGGG